MKLKASKLKHKLKKQPVVNPSAEFWGHVSERENVVATEMMATECRKRTNRVAVAEEKVHNIEEELSKAREVHALARIAVLRGDLKKAEHIWELRRDELREFLDSDDLGPGPLRDAEVSIADTVLYRYQSHQDEQLGRQNTPPLGPVEHFEGAFAGNRYQGDFLPWRRERHGQGETRYSDGTRVVGTYRRNVVHGLAVMHYADDVRVYVGRWRHGRRSGYGLLEGRHGVQHIR